MTMRRRVLVVGNLLTGTGSNQSTSEETVAQLREAGWSVIATSSRRDRVLRLADMLLAVVRNRHSVDVAEVSIFSDTAFLWAEATTWALRRFRIPYVATLRGGALPEFARRWPRRVKAVLWGAAIVVSPSPYLQRELAWVRDDIRVVPNAVNAGAYEHRPQRLLRPRMVWLRAFHRMYDPVTAVVALAELLARHPEATLRMVGPDKGDGSLQAVRETALRLGIAERLGLTLGVPKAEVPKVLAEGDVFLNTSLIDNTPVSVIEALAAGLCVISSAVGGVPDLLTDGVDGLLVPPGRPAATAAAVERLLTNPDLAAGLSTNARRKAEMWSWDRVRPLWSGLLADAALGRAAASHETPRVSVERD